jgi:hypothetical protein
MESILTSSRAIGQAIYLEKEIGLSAERIN